MKLQPLNVEGLEFFFREHYAYLCLVSLAIVKDSDVSKDIVQDFFISYWERRNRVNLTVSFKAYAVRAIKNLSQQHLRNITKEESLIQELSYSRNINQEHTEKPSNRQVLYELVNKLPESRRKIFISYVVYGQSYAEIAENNGVSVNTVKTQMKRAYRFLRTEANPDILYLVVLKLLEN
ncbi:sigma-70 family RNA polymerase sigma factor [Zobellia amurskyensis]|uniref:Sigma-70 family RNA polymerase sigma factor n=1 Tax=Zobellia amurskyensis TaxID=248905 RepID=A0A7X2ZR10_9FLAO|nr:sigma-70 family RNA polymerase sigma factor [Zobellia amurskyensis]MUH34800.1 sigma-70 family RNA polymerase sigma factor [Zobellia amurskyensis]